MYIDKNFIDTLINMDINYTEITDVILKSY